MRISASMHIPIFLNQVFTHHHETAKLKFRLWLALLQHRACDHFFLFLANSTILFQMKKPAQLNAFFLLSDLLSQFMMILLSEYAISTRSELWIQKHVRFFVFVLLLYNAGALIEGYILLNGVQAGRSIFLRISLYTLNSR